MFGSYKNNSSINTKSSGSVQRVSIRSHTRITNQGSFHSDDLQKKEYRRGASVSTLTIKSVGGYGGEMKQELTVSYKVRVF